MAKKAFEERAIKLAKLHAKDLAPHVLQDDVDKANRFIQVYEKALDGRFEKLMDQYV